MELRRLDNNTYDLFQGKGWDNHTRVRKGRSSTFVLLGDKLPRSELKHLHDVLHPTMPITYGQDLSTMLHNFHNGVMR